MRKLSLVRFISLSALVILTVLWSAGCSKSPKKGESLNIGVILPLTGDYAPYGQSSKRGMEVALTDLPDGGMIGGFTVKTIFEDDKGQAKDAVTAARKMLDIDRCPVILGGLASSVALATAPIAEQSRAVLMCVFASSPKITSAGDYVFRIMPSDAFQGALLPTWLFELNIKRVATVYVNNDWGVSLKNAFNLAFLEGGGSIVLEEGISEQARDVRNIVAKIKNIESQIDAIFLPTYPEEGGLLLRQIKEARIVQPIFGGDTWANDLLVKVAGQAADGVRFLAPMQYEGPEMSEFLAKYKSKYGLEPDLPASAGYDSMKVILYAVDSLVKKGQEISGENIKTILYTIEDFMGATGRTSFDSNGDVISKEFSRRTIKSGQIESVQK